jgi:spore germination protein GerM
MKNSRAFALLILLIVVAFGSWWYLSHRTPAVSNQITVYYTKMDGSSEAAWKLSVSPPKAGTSAGQQLHETAFYAAVQAVAGPPSDAEAIRFPTGTQVNSVTISGSTATVDLSADVEKQPGGSFGENGEFKSLVYTVTALPGINAVQITVAGKKIAALPGGHLELDQPLHRSDW